MQFPSDLLFQKSDEWVKVEDATATIGISDFAQDQLSDVVYVEFACEIGDEVSVGDTLATVESVKAAADVSFPVSGKVVEINEKLADTPELLNSAPYGEAWMVKVAITNPDEINELMDATTYEKDTQAR
ncbi:MAG: glycine cleavage system protein GcvH [Anaerolineaceae bacterium]|nr:glycine cleavage system protein GcvH [Anaerolineaceae bacterium]